MSADREETTLGIADRRFVRLPSLVVVASGRDGVEVVRPLTMTPLVVGTAADCELVVNDPAVSRRHCMVTLTARGVLVRDLHSKNGTTVAGVEAVEAFLALSSFAKIGGTTLRLQVTGPPADVPLFLGARFGDVLGGSIPMRALFAQLERAARADAPILLRGETGTGKELLARAVHGCSARAAGPFVVLDGEGDLAAQVVDASGGTLFVDELGDLSSEAQARLVRILETNDLSVGAALIAATTLDLGHDTTVRPDLVYRIAAVDVRVPPLRERKEDIELLVEHFLANDDPPRRVSELPAGGLAMLLGHGWPGNVRELRNTVARLVRFPHLGHSALELHSPSGASSTETARLFTLPLRDARQTVVERFEAQYLLAKLREHQGNVSKMASAIGVSRQMVHRMLTRYGIGSRDGV